MLDQVGRSDGTRLHTSGGGDGACVDLPRVLRTPGKGFPALQFLDRLVYLCLVPSVGGGSDDGKETRRDVEKCKGGSCTTRSATGPLGRLTGPGAGVPRLRVSLVHSTPVLRRRHVSDPRPSLSTSPQWRVWRGRWLAGVETRIVSPTLGPRLRAVTTGTSRSVPGPTGA